MPSVPLPQFYNLDRFGDSMNKANSAYGVEGKTLDVPTSDAAKVPGNIGTTKPDHFRADYRSPSVESPLQPMSIATRSVPAPPLGAWLPTNTHQPNYLDPHKSHVSPEPQGPGKVRR